jgi:hypothetical protein
MVVIAGRGGKQKNLSHGGNARATKLCTARQKTNVTVEAADNGNSTTNLLTEVARHSYLTQFVWI